MAKQEYSIPDSWFISRKAERKAKKKNFSKKGKSKKKGNKGK